MTFGFTLCAPILRKRATANHDFVLAILALFLWIDSGAVTAAEDGSFRDAVTAYEDAEFERALEYLDPLAQAGDSDAQYLTGFIFGLDEYGGFDLDLALEWMVKAAEQGQPMAQTFYWVSFLGTPDENPRPLESLRWLEAAAAAGVAEAKFQLAQWLMSSSGEREEIIDLLQSAIESGHVIAQFTYGEVIMRSLRGTYDMRFDDEIAAIMKELAEDGFANGQVGYGLHRYSGQGAAKDPVDAFKWLLLAEEQGSVEARGYLALLWTKFSPSDREEGEAQVSAWKEEAYHDRDRRIGLAAEWCFDNYATAEDCTSTAYWDDLICTSELLTAFIDSNVRSTELYNRCRQSFLAEIQSK